MLTWDRSHCKIKTQTFKKAALTSIALKCHLYCLSGKNDIYNKKVFNAQYKLSALDL